MLQQLKGANSQKGLGTTALIWRMGQEGGFMDLAVLLHRIGICMEGDCGIGFAAALAVLSQNALFLKNNMCEISNDEGFSGQASKTVEQLNF